MHRSARNTIVHSPLAVEASLRCSILSLGPFAPNIVMIYFGQCQVHLRMGSWHAAAAAVVVDIAAAGTAVAAIALASDKPVPAGVPSVAASEPDGPVDGHIVERIAVLVGGLFVGLVAQPAVEHTLVPHTVLASASQSHPATAAVDEPQWLVVRHRSGSLAF